MCLSPSHSKGKRRPRNDRTRPRSARGTRLRPMILVGGVAPISVLAATRRDFIGPSGRSLALDDAQLASVSVSPDSAKFRHRLLLHPIGCYPERSANRIGFSARPFQRGKHCPLGTDARPFVPAFAQIPPSAGQERIEIDQFLHVYAERRKIRFQWNGHLWGACRMVMHGEFAIVRSGYVQLDVARHAAGVRRQAGRVPRRRRGTA